MIRRLLVLVLVVCVTGNSLWAAALVGDDECGATCCRTPGHDEQSESLSKGCCSSQCEEPGEAQPVSPKGVLGSARNDCADASVAIGVATWPLAPARVLQSSARVVIQSTHIYLRIGTLLI